MATLPLLSVWAAERSLKAKRNRPDGQRQVDKLLQRLWSKPLAKPTGECDPIKPGFGRQTNTLMDGISRQDFKPNIESSIQ